VDIPSWFVNPRARDWRTRPFGQDAAAFHRALPGYAPTRLVELPQLAAELEVGRVFVKEESSRFGLPAFKFLGASFAVARELARRWGVEGVPGLESLRERAATEPPVELIAATDGNHGRAVAHAAALIGLPARIFFPASISSAAKTAIAAEGATAIELDKPYDEVVDAAVAAAAEAGDRGLLVQDSARPGYESVPAAIVEGYTTLLAEAFEQMAEAGAEPPGMIAVPVGVGSLAETIVRAVRSRGDETAVLSVEPSSAPSVIAALAAGEPVAVPTGETIMKGLNCGTVAANAWPALRDGLDLAVVVDDAAALEAMRDLQALGVDAGPCGAASLAGARAVLAEPVRRMLTGIGMSRSVLLLSTEGRAANPLPGS